MLLNGITFEIRGFEQWPFFGRCSKSLASICYAFYFLKKFNDHSIKIINIPEHVKTQKIAFSNCSGCDCALAVCIDQPNLPRPAKIKRTVPINVIIEWILGVKRKAHFAFKKEAVKRAEKKAIAIKPNVLK